MARKDSWSDAEKAKFLELHAQKKTWAQIGVAIGRTRNAVSSYAAENGYKSGWVRHIELEDAKGIIANLEAGMLFNECARLAGFSDVSITNRIKNDPAFAAAAAKGRQVRMAALDRSRATRLHAARDAANIVRAQVREKRLAEKARLREEATARRLAAKAEKVAEHARLKAERAAAAGVGSVKPGRRRGGGRSHHMASPLPRDNSLAAMAADHLRRDYAPVYHRGREDKRQLGIWQVGGRKMPEAEMIDLARSKGFGRDVAPIAAPVIRSSILSAPVYRGTIQPPAGYNRGWLPPVKTMFESHA